MLLVSSNKIFTDQLLIEHNLDLDWEYPTDKVNFGSFVKKLKATYGTQILLSRALGASLWTAGQSYDTQSIFTACDFVNIMSYDFNGWQANGHDGPVGHNSPIFGMPTDTVDQKADNIDAFIKGFVLLPGVDKSKIILGIPTYGKVFTLKDPSQNVVFSTGRFSIDEECISICGKVKSGAYRSVPDSNRKAIYALAGSTWVGYESPETAAMKAQYIKDNNLDGAMFWSLNGDDLSGTCSGVKSPIIRTVFNMIIGGVS